MRSPIWTTALRGPRESFDDDNVGQLGELVRVEQQFAGAIAATHNLFGYGDLASSLSGTAVSRNPAGSNGAVTPNPDPSDTTLPSATPTDPAPSAKPTPEPPTPQPTSSDTSSGAAVALNGNAAFEHFTVTVLGSTPAAGRTDVDVQVCLVSLTADAINGSTRISREPWSATTTEGTVLRPVTAIGAANPFPSQSRAKPGECATGMLRFASANLASITYRNGQGDNVTIP